MGNRLSVSAMSSPLTSLSSLDDFDEEHFTLSEGPLISRDELHAAQVRSVQVLSSSRHVKVTQLVATVRLPAHVQQAHGAETCPYWESKETR